MTADIDISFLMNELEQSFLVGTCTVEFKFFEEIYLQKDGVLMRSTFGPLFADIFMVKQKTK